MKINNMFFQIKRYTCKMLRVVSLPLFFVATFSFISLMIANGARAQNTNDTRTASEVVLTPEESAWIEEKHSIRVRVTDRAPAIYSKNGKPLGIAVDLLNKVSKLSGIKFQYVLPSPSFSQDLEGLIQHTGPDIIPTLQQTRERKQKILFSDVYLSSPRFIFIRDNAPFVSSLEELSGKKVAVVKEYLVHKWLAQDYLDINLMLCKNNREALTAVSSGKAFAYIGPLRNTSFSINEFGLNNLKATAPTGLPDAHTSMGIRSDWPALQSIINKSLGLIPEAEKAAVINKWSSVTVEYGIRPIDVLKWILILAGIAFGILFLFVIWNRSLNRSVKKRTSQLYEKESEIRNLIEQSPVSIQIHTPDGRLLRTNDAFAKLFGLSKEALAELYKKYNILQDEQAKRLGLMPFIEKVFLGEDSVFPRFEYDGIDTLKTLRIENPVSRKCCVQTRGFPLKDKDGNVASVVFLSEDFTGRKLSEDALIESEKNFRSLIEQSPYSIQILDPDGRITQVNEAFKKLWSISEEDLPRVLQKYNILEDEEARKRGVMPLIEKAFRGENVTLPVIEYDAPSTMESMGMGDVSSRKTWIQARLYAVRNSKNEIVSVVMIEEDVTELKESEKQMNQLRSELIHTSRTGTLAELTAALAHEINHPLGSILNNANAAKRLLKRKDPDLDEIREIIDDVISEDRRASDVIHKLRAMMKKDEVTLSPLHINDIIEEVLILTHSELVIKKILLSKKLAQDLPVLNGDRVQLQQVFLNLIINANDSMKNSTKKELHISTAEKDAEHILFCIKDTGTGFDEKQKERLFNPFFTTKREGMGMGLSVCRTIINAHEGDIWAENNEEGGASFHITLPIYKEQQT